MNSPQSQPTCHDGWMFNGSAEYELCLKPLCEMVQKFFTLPNLRLCRYFAAAEDPFYQMDPPHGFGRHYRGFHIPRKDASDLLQPEHIQCFYRSSEDIPVDAPLDQLVAFDNMIYIRKTTCDDTVGCVTTFGHELQHFVQYGFTPRLTRANSVLYRNLKRLEPTAIATDVPHEREANIVSKRVAELVCGKDAVNRFANDQIQLMEKDGGHEQRQRWVFFRDVPSSIQYNLLEETISLVEKYRSVLDFGFDVSQPEWWVGPLQDKANGCPA